MTPAPDPATERRFPRRLLLAVPAAAGAAAVPTAASAAPPDTAWRLGGNDAVASDGSNYLGPTNGAPLVVKTQAGPKGGPLERLRVTPQGRVGVGTKAPEARLDARATEPIAVSGTTSSADDTVARAGVKGSATGSGETFGVWGLSDEGVGVYAEGGAYGVFADGALTGVRGGGRVEGTVGSGRTGVLGYGWRTDRSTHDVTGVVGTVDDASEEGPGGDHGVWGIGGETAAVRGDGRIALMGRGDIYGLLATALDDSGLTFGVYASAGSPQGYAGWFQGEVFVNGTLAKTAGAFQIDHPLDPENRWLRHSFVESPDMLNVYDGTVVLDEAGEAEVRLPSYFTALNRDPRYQLTCVGGHAPVYVADRVRDGRFRIAGGRPGLEVSWQVTGVRRDDYAERHRIVVEEDKPEALRGTRVFVPEGSSATATRPVPVDPPPSRRRQPQTAP